MGTVSKKRCCSCKTLRSTSKFHVNRQHADGLQAMCALCISVYKRGYNAGRRREQKVFG